MQKAYLWIVCFALMVGGAFALGRIWSEKRSTLVQNQDLDNGFIPVPFALEPRPFVVVICGYNNGAFVAKTLRSVFSQAYEAYRVVYIDDASTDGSFAAASDSIYASSQMLRTSVVQNEQRLGLLANLVRVVEACQDEEIVVVLNGEDWLAHEWVLATLNRYYADPDLWMTYGQSCEFPSYKKGGARFYRKSEWKALREAPFVAGCLQTFYAGLFRQIPLSDLMQTGLFFPGANDLAMMLPLLEMAEGHFQFVPEVLYVHNRCVATHDPETEARSEQVIRSRKPCQPLVSFQRVRSFEEGM